MVRVKLIGPPGTGKTERLKNIVRDKVAAGVNIDEIVYTSFTNAAANEAAERVCREFDLDYRPEWFRTEHSCCFRMLGLDPDFTFSRKWMRKFSSGYPLYRYSWEDVYSDEWSTMDAEGRFSSESMLRTIGDFAEFFYGLSRNMMLNPAETYSRFCTKADLPDGFTSLLFQQYCERRDAFKRNNRLYDFSDMIGLTLQRKLVPDGMRILICDEAQDMSPLQWALINMWASCAEEVYIAGDFLQSVYQFQGATPELFLQFNGEEEVLGQSYRLTPQVKAYSESIARMTRLPYPQFKPDERPGRVYRATFASLDWSTIDDAFLLCRTRYLLSTFRDQLMQKFIPFKCERGDDNPMNTKQGYAMRAIIKLAQDRSVSEEEVKAIAEFTTKPFLAYGSKAHIKRLLEGDYNRRQLWQMGFTEEFFKHLSEPDVILCRHFDLDERRYLQRLYGMYGVDVKPCVTLTTMHGSKGRERKLVMLSPDLTLTTWNSYLSNTVPETLLQYVAATRAREKLMVLYPTQKYSFPLPTVKTDVQTPRTSMSDIEEWVKSGQGGA